MTGLHTLVVAIALALMAGCDQSSGQATTDIPPSKPPAQKIPEFEDSAFCKKYHCRLDAPVYVVGPDGKVDSWHYTYRLEGNDLMNVDFSLSTNGERREPYVAVYWRPLKLMAAEGPTASATTGTVSSVAPEKEIASVSDMVDEILSSDEFDASLYVTKCLHSYTHEKTGIGGRLIKSYAVGCTYSQSNDQELPEQRMFPQLTLVISKLPILQNQH